MLNTDRIKSQKIELTDVRWKDNLHYNPNISANFDRKSGPTDEERDMMRQLDEDKKTIRISSDISTEILEYFLNEFNLKYPTLKKGRYKGSMSIDDIEKGVEPVMKYISVRGTDGEEITHGLRADEDEGEN